jgi:hypothetical protein
MKTPDFRNREVMSLTTQSHPAQDSKARTTNQDFQFNLPPFLLTSRTQKRAFQVKKIWRIASTNTAKPTPPYLKCKISCPERSMTLTVDT